jgi:hypothetical protein
MPFFAYNYYERMTLEKMRDQSWMAEEKLMGKEQLYKEMGRRVELLKEIKDDVKGKPDSTGSNSPQLGA